MDLAEAKPLGVATGDNLAANPNATPTANAGLLDLGSAQNSNADSGLIPAGNSLPKVIRPAGCMEPDVTSSLPLGNTPSAQ